MYTVIEIKKTYSSHLECIIKYFHILNILNSLGLNDNEVEIMAFACVYGNIVGGAASEEYAKTFSKTRSSLRGGITSLVRKGFLIRKGKKTFLNKQLHIEFDSLILNIHIGDN